VGVRGVGESCGRGRGQVFWGVEGGRRWRRDSMVSGRDGDGFIMVDRLLSKRYLLSGARRERAVTHLQFVAGKNMAGNARCRAAIPL
jgi:hypothetical protein